MRSISWAWSSWFVLFIFSCCRFRGALCLTIIIIAVAVAIASDFHDDESQRYWIDGNWHRNVCLCDFWFGMSCLSCFLSFHPAYSKQCWPKNICKQRVLAFCVPVRHLTCFSCLVREFLERDYLFYTEWMIFQWFNVVTVDATACFFFSSSGLCDDCMRVSVCTMNGVYRLIEL